MSKYIVIFRAKGPIENITLEKKLAKHDFKTITYEDTKRVKKLPKMEFRSTPVKPDPDILFLIVFL